MSKYSRRRRRSEGLSDDDIERIKAMIIGMRCSIVGIAEEPPDDPEVTAVGGMMLQILLEAKGVDPDTIDQDKTDEMIDSIVTGSIRGLVEGGFASMTGNDGG